MRSVVAALVCVTACRPEAAPTFAAVLPVATAPTPAPETTPTPAPTPAADVPSARADRDPTGVTPPPVDADLAALPLDVRLPDEATLLRTHRKECGLGPKPACEHRIDFDGDGTPERVLLVRARDTRHLGIAVVWARGEVSLLGADARMRQLHTDVYVDDVELAWDEIEADFELERWRVAEIVGDGFAMGAPRKRGASPKVALRAPARMGGGVFLGNSDSSTILYWDGASWRRLVLF
ncbi:MAG TPA: hypothetical protein VG755_41195 [Nannocystaceae bacterium]|nr:hypothetical protein [Nannocystaceae bacterium]